MSKKDRQKWNEKHQRKLKHMSHSLPEPNERLREWIPHISASGSHIDAHALDLACGLGGNAFFLAQNGFRVNTVDISDAAVQYINEQSSHLQLPIQAYQMDLDEGNTFIQHFNQQYDLLVHTYFLDRDLIPMMKELTAPNGTILMETFFKGETTDPHPRMNDAFKLRAGEYQQWFQDWTIIHLIEDEEKGIASILCRKNG